MIRAAKRNSADPLLAAIGRSPAGVLPSFRRERKPADELCRPGSRRLTIDIPAADHAKFKSACAAHSTTMHAEIMSFVHAAIAAPDRLLSEALFLEISPELKVELLNHAAARRTSLADLLLDAFALLRRKEPEREIGARPIFYARQSGRRSIEALRTGRHP